MDTKFTLGISILSYVGIAALVISAAFFDLRTRRIPNPLILAGAFLGIFLRTWEFGASGTFSSLLGLLTGFALFLPGYLLRMTGGGDLKLMAAIGTYLGVKLILVAFLIYILMGLIWVFLYGLFKSTIHGGNSPFTRYWGMWRAFLATGLLTYHRPVEDEFMGRRVPMAPAIAIGALLAPLVFHP